MRPIQLRVKGFTCFRDQVAVDFADLDLFAITGPTGSGKSSLIDAMTFALYGRSPRAEKEKKDCIALGMDAAEVGLEFSTGNGSAREHYRVARSLRRKGTPQVKLERLDGGGWADVAAGDREVTDLIGSIVGLDFDGFTRSVVLPQNQFDRFLSGKAEERRKILDDLLRLGVYERIRKRTDDRYKECSQKARALRTEIENHYSDCTEENLERLRAELRAAEERVARLQEEIEALGQAAIAASDLAGARGDLATAVQELQDAERKHQAALQLLETGEAQLTKLEAQIAAVEQKITQNPYDDQLYALLNRALPLARDVERLTGELSKLSARATDEKERLAQSEEVVKSCGATLRGAEAERDAAARALDDTRQRHAAAYLRSHLQPGDPCPVCTQPVGELPRDGSHPDLEAAEKGWQEAGVAVKAAEQALHTAEGELTRRRAQLDSILDQIKRSDAEWASKAQEVEDLLGPTRPDDAAAIETMLKQQEQARAELEELKGQQKQLEEERRQLRAQIEDARHNAAALAERMKAAAEAVQRVEAAVQDATSRLRRLAEGRGWQDVLEMLDGGDPTAAIGDRKEGCQQELGQAIAAVAVLKNEIERVQAGIPVRKQKEEEAARLEAEAAIAQDLANLLGGKRFLTYVEEAALKVLAQDGSARLEELSSGRYSFDVQQHEFLVADHWNADETRAVTTLSGGETFLASVALAEALAERLPDLSAGGGAALESLFIDEGFGALDESSLDAVAQALESLRARSRIVCIVTHLSQLADRMPARIDVSKSESGSRLQVGP